MREQIGEFTFVMELLSDYQSSKLMNLINSNKLYTICKKALDREYIYGYFKLNLESSNGEYIIRVYDHKKKMIAYIIIFVHEQMRGNYAEVMILCANSKDKGIGTALLNYAEKAVNEHLDIHLMVLCSLNAPYNFYKRSGYQIVDNDICYLLNKKYKKVDTKTYEKFLKFYKEQEQLDKNFDMDFNELKSKCPVNKFDSCIYMYKYL